MRSILVFLCFVLPASAGDWSLLPESAAAPWQMVNECEEAPKPRQRPKSTAKLPTHRAVLVFTASWCGSCQQMKRTTYPPLIAKGWRISNVDDPKGDKNQHIILIDVDKHEHLQDQLKVKAYPTIISWDGKTVTRRVTGYADPFAIGTAYDASKPKTEQVSINGYRPGWTFPGSGRADLISHLSGPNHNYTVKSLRRMSIDDLQRLHDSDHNKASRPRTRTLTVFPFIQGSR